MIAEGKIKFKQINLEYCESKQYELGSVAISYEHKIVPITIDRIKNTIEATHSGGKKTSIDLNSKGIFANCLLYHPIVEYGSHNTYTPNGDGTHTYLGVRELPVKEDLFQFIIDNNLNNSKIEYDDSEKIISTINYFKKPENPKLTPVFKIKRIYFGTYGALRQQLSDYIEQDYNAYEEAEVTMLDIIKDSPMEINNNGQYYFTIEKLIKRQEYEKQTFPSKI